jgi:serine/alanine adding enzyme
MTAALRMPTPLTEPQVRVTRGDSSTAVWRNVVTGLSDSTLAHDPAWFEIIRQTYGHEPLGLIVDDDGACGVLPAVVVRRPLFGTVVASMPFLDMGGPCASSMGAGEALVKRLLDEARRIGADSVELRSTRPLQLPVTPMEHKVSLGLSLPADPVRLWRELDGAVRNQVRKAEKSGLSVEIGGRQHLETFYTIFAKRMRDLGSPVHAFRFFSNIFDDFGSRARLSVVRKGTIPVGALIAVAFKNTLSVPWASCLHEHFRLCPNMLLYWETIRQACVQGFTQFDFGRSTRDSGTYRFKRQWGAREQPLFWYAVPISARARRAAPVTVAHSSLLAGSWRCVPLSITRHLGPHIRRYLTQ